MLFLILLEKKEAFFRDTLRSQICVVGLIKINNIKIFISKDTYLLMQNFVGKKVSAIFLKTFYILFIFYEARWFGLISDKSIT